MNKHILYLILFLLLIWSIFALQFFKDNPTVLTTMLLLSLESTSLLILIANPKCLINSKLNVAVLVWTVYAILNTIVCSNDLFLDLRNVLWWPLIYYLFYYITLNDDQDTFVRILIKFFPFLFIVIFFEFLSFRADNMFRYTSSGRLIFEASNGIFFNALLLPFAFLLNKKKLKYFFLIIGLIVVLISFKRSALIFTVLILIMALYYDFIGSKKTNLVKGLFLSAIVIASGFIAFGFVDSKTNGFITERFKLIENDKGSGRDEIYKNVWKLYENRSFEYKLIGSGPNTVVRDNFFKSSTGEIENLSAHNDFLEILYDFGIIGLLFYLNFIARILQRLFYIKGIDDNLFQANFAAFIIFFVMSMVSHLVIYPNYFIYLVIIWAISEGLIKRNEIKNSYV